MSLCTHAVYSGCKEISGLAGKVSLLPVPQLLPPALTATITTAESAIEGILKVAREVGVGTGTVQRIKQEMTGPFDAVTA